MFSEKEIRQGATAASFERGETYFQNEATLSMTRRGDSFHAEVEGSQYQPYQVTVRLAPDNESIVSASCSCHYEGSGWCKHIVAVLLEFLDDPKKVEMQPTLEDLLGAIDAEQLKTLLIELAQSDLRIHDALMLQLQSLPPESGAPEIPVDTQALRRQVRGTIGSLSAMRPSEAYWHVSGVVDEMHHLLQPAYARINVGDGNSALTILQAITAEYVDSWYEMDDSDGEAGDFFEELGRAWTRALLTAEITPAQRRKWAKQFEQWQHEIDDYGIDTAFQPAIKAAQQGWDDPDLVAVLNGEKPELPYNEDESYDGSKSDVIEARLDILERQQRFEEALRLARAADQFARQSAILVALGRPEEALSVLLEGGVSPQEVLMVGERLSEAGAVSEALRAGEYGLSLGNHAALALWLRNLAREQDADELALRAAIALVRAAPSVPDFQIAGELAGEQWPTLREELLNYLREHDIYHREGAVEIFLHEDLPDDALAKVAKAWDRALVARVVDAVTAQRPNEVIPICRAQAEPTMNEGKSAYYDAAARWVERAKLAYRVAGREAEWERYINDLLTKHQKKYKLRPLLEAVQKRR